MLQEKSKPASTPLSEVGEFGWIETLKKQKRYTHPTTKVGLGDDAAVIQPEKEQLLVSTDTLAEGVHFNLAYMPLKHLGYKAVVVGLSDIYAMNAKPTQLFVSLAVSNRFPVEALEELYSGIHLACELHQVELAGGDTTSSASGMVITITAIGQQEEHKITRRKGAKENDLLVVSGDLGAAYLGLQVLERENQVWKVNPQVQPDLSPYNYLVERQLKPEPRKDIVALLEELDVQPTAMLDVSDGLASEVLHLSQQSECGFALYEDKIPLDPQVITTAEEFGVNPIVCAMNGGEDYELLFTVALSDHDKIKGNPNLTVIGHAVDLSSGNYLLTKDQQSKVPLTAQGWEGVKRED